MPSGILLDAGLLSGVDGQLRLRREGRVARVARAGLLVAAAAVILTAPVRGGLALLAGLPAWLLVGARSTALVALVLFSLALVRARRWLRLLAGPLRYACCFEPLVAAPGREPPAGTASLHHDLAGLLLSRHPRLGVRTAEPKAGAAFDAHTVRIGGVRLLRTGRDGGAYVEVRPSVHVGAAARPTDLARPTEVRMAGDELTADEHALLVDRVCASVADELYRQLADHVADELAFLPTGYLRARGMWHEAEDHLRSCTVHAHERARRLFGLAAERLDPGVRPLPPAGLRRAGALAVLAVARGSAFLRRVGARAYPRLVDRDVLWARCMIGSATALVHERILSGFPGRLPTAIYEAPPILRSALSRLEALPAGAPGREAALGDGHVTLALVLAHLGDSPGARRHLERVRMADLGRAERDPTSLLAAAELDGNATSRIRRLRRAASIDPRSGTARWRLALEAERQWRSAEQLDPTEAAWVLEEYGKVLALQPGHLGAWASLAHIQWLLGRESDARDALATGRGARPLGAGTFVTELDLGTARVAAESGRFDEAYRHARSALAGLVAEGVPQLADGEPRSYGAWAFSGSPAAVDRCRRYRERVTEQLDDARVAGGWPPAVLAEVDAFVWYDLGECLRYAGRADEAQEAFRRATEADPGCVPAHFQLGDLHRRQGDERGTAAAAGQIAGREPTWVSGALAQALHDADRATDARRRAARAARAAAESEAGRTAIERRRLGIGLGDVPAGAPDEALAGDLERLENEVREQRLRSERHAAQARAAAARLRDAVPAVVPHGWLWRHVDGERDLDWMALHPPDPRHERRWERQLDEHHAVALHLYGRAWLRFPPEDVREELAYQRAAALLRCVRERLLPRDRALLVDLLLAEAAVGAHSRLAALVADVAADTDREAGLVLTEVLATENDEHADWQADVLIAACEEPGFSPTLSGWMADRAVSQLLPRLDAARASRLTAAARAGFLRGLRSPHPGDLLVVGDALNHLCDREHAAAAYRAVLEAGFASGADTGGDQEATRRRAALRLAAIEFLAGRWTPSEGEPPPGDGGAGPTRAEIADAIGRELAGIGQRPCGDAAALDAGYEYARLWVAAERETAARARDEHAWRDAEAARLALVAARPPSSVAPRPGAPASATPAATRLAVETHPDVAGDGDPRGDPAGLPALHSAAEAARGDVGRRFGVAVPEIAWRSTARGPEPGGYRMLIDGVPVASGRADEGAVAVGHRLARCLQKWLASFVGVQEVRSALDAWAAAGGDGSAPDRRSVVAELGTGTELRTLTVCLRALVSEQVPILDLDALLDAYRRARPDAGSVTELVGHLRRSVRERLPGNAPGWGRLRLPDGLEADIRRRLGPPEQPVLSPEGLEPTLSALRALLDAAGDEPVAVVTDPALRFVVRSLLAVENPRVPVLAVDEVVTTIRLPDDPPSPSPVEEHREGELAP